MPLVNIFLVEGKSKEYIRSLSQGIHQALQETWLIPENDFFQIIHEKKAEHLLINPIMWNVNRTADVVVIQITTSSRTKEMKLKLYRRLPEVLYEKIKLKPDNVFINITHSSYEDWSFGNGKAQLLQTE